MENRLGGRSGELRARVPGASHSDSALDVRCIVYRIVVRVFSRRSVGPGCFVLAARVNEPERVKGRCEWSVMKRVSGPTELE